ncbi:hypothetical protein SAMN04487846_2760 [Microbacterium sp. cf046]|uniref:hypothetical protein n=1 Tax=Microbacterium sp. cf046 TaxID=1761803 RepID=UPI0008E84136|nr:hypothetical protein [Microbacterium sp. cf046]SFS13711.1 hypothetical protein SAMN04487846_2760 [Microbacterium sp. cf046]
MAWSTESRTWRSGPWSLQLRDDEFADIAFEGRVVLRSVRAVVRDRNWDTARLVLDRVKDSGATLTLHVRSDGLGSSFSGIVRVEARGAARLVVLTDLEAEGPFSTNRTGLVVLHPPRLAGTALRVTHSDGSVEESSFPRAISPHQPVLDIAGLAWLDEGSEVAVGFDGDVFEMEDQRNWSDASYKTYSRPLGLPFPYDVAAAERVRQSVRIDVREVAASASSADSDLIHLHAAGPVFELAIGAATAPGPDPTGATTAGAVLVEVDLRTPNWRAALSRAAGSGSPLDVRVVASADAPYDALAEAVRALASTPGVKRIGVFEADLHVTDAAVLSALRQALDRAGVTTSVIGGSRAHFTELNREWAIVPRELDGIAFSTTPLFHSLGTEQLVESVAVQRTIALQAVELAGGMPVHIGPVTLRPRYNDVATTPQPLPTGTDLSGGYGAEYTGAADPRQSAPELAAWTIASAAALAVPGVASIAYFEQWGERGIRSSAGEPFDVAEAIEALAALGGPGAELLWGDSPDGLLWAVGSRRQGGDAVLVANLDIRPREVTLVIDGGSAPVVVPLEPFSFARR